MSIYTLTCPECSAQITLSGRRLLVRVDSEDATSGEVLFTCLMCHQAVTVPVGVDMVAVLVTSGVTFLSLSEQPVEHPESRVDGPAFTPDDLLDLHTALEGADWFTALAGVADVADAA